MKPHNFPDPKKIKGTRLGREDAPARAWIFGEPQPYRLNLNFSFLSFECHAFNPNVYASFCLSCDWRKGSLGFR